MEDPDFVPPTAANASSVVTQNGKRQRDGDSGDSGRQAKREKADDSDDEMEIEDEEEAPKKNDTCTWYYFGFRFSRMLHCIS